MRKIGLAVGMRRKGKFSLFFFLFFFVLLCRDSFHGSIRKAGYHLASPARVSKALWYLLFDLSIYLSMSNSLGMCFQNFVDSKAIYSLHLHVILHLLAKLLLMNLVLTVQTSFMLTGTSESRILSKLHFSIFVWGEGSSKVVKTFIILGLV